MTYLEGFQIGKDLSAYIKEMEHLNGPTKFRIEVKVGKDNLETLKESALSLSEARDKLEQHVLSTSENGRLKEYEGTSGWIKKFCVSQHPRSFIDKKQAHLLFPPFGTAPIHLCLSQ